MTENIFQILISDEPQARPSQRAEAHAASFREAYPGASYRLHDDASLRRFLLADFGAETLDAYDRLAPFAFKADLARYCLLYRLGGVYADLSHLHLHPVPMPPGVGLAVFRDLSIHPPWAVSNGLIAARAGRPELARVIRAIVMRAKTGYVGQSPLDPTGPYLFGSVLAHSVADPSVQFGWSRRKTSLARKLGLPVRNRVQVEKVLPGGRVVALKNKRDYASIGDLAEGGSNDYGRMWGAGRTWAAGPAGVGS